MRWRHSSRIYAVGVEHIGEGNHSDQHPGIGPAYHRQDIVTRVAHARERETERLVAMDVRDDPCSIVLCAPRALHDRGDGDWALVAKSRIVDVLDLHHSDEI